MGDALYTGLKYRTFYVIDDYNREALHIETDLSLTSERVTRVLEQVIAVRGRPERIRLDNGPELTSATFTAWAKTQGIAIEFIKPGKPSKNGYIERFNGIYREAVLDAWMFADLNPVRQAAEQWLIEYNLERPRDSLGDATPIEFLTQRGHA
jgi:putative transposase